MSINLKTPDTETREQRLGTITQWEGTAAELARDSAFTYGCSKGCDNGGRRLCEQNAPFAQAAMCAETIAVSNATIIQGSVVIQHSPIGCAASQSSTCRNYRDLAAQRGWTLEDPVSICTNLTEQDMVFGGIAKLEQAIRIGWERHHPKVIFIAASCATGIIGDDVDSAAQRLEEEIGIPVVPLHCEGFKSKHWSNGWDVIEHGILRNLVRKDPPRKQKDLINVIHLGGRDVFAPLLGPLGLRVNLVMGGNTLDRLAQTSEAAATVTMCFVLSYLATGLEQEFGVPEIKAPLPYGLDATDNWLRDIARVTGQGEDLVEEQIARERARIAPELERLRQALAGKRGFVAAGAAFAHGLLADLRELGVSVDSAFSYHHDPSTDSGDPRQDSLTHLVDTWGDVPNFTVSPDQHFQAHAALQRTRPDFVICRHTGTVAVLAGRLGIPVLPIFYSNDGLGYEGLLTIGRAILRILPRRRFYQDVAAHSRFPYQKWWLEQTDPYALEARPTESGRPL
ncbi:nitrogenase component 1 [Telmatospirillum sp.]|uniref:nitrogenase component 1 n=1 Tax=Telmatospirillum sp. TaxID=2079197 RepID=UPI0028436FF5|nr:nitrogenase component 1 [Telmatospirillum sp.]MDR3441172.1 nitrogenase component 1 [Telmatospirillum sp.]